MHPEPGYLEKKKTVDKWINSSGRWWYRHADGSCTKIRMGYIENEWYYLIKMAG